MVIEQYRTPPWLEEKTIVDLVKPEWIKEDPKRGVTFPIDKDTKGHVFLYTPPFTEKGTVYTVFGWEQIPNGMYAGVDIARHELVLSDGFTKGPVEKTSPVQVAKSLGLYDLPRESAVVRVLEGWLGRGERYEFVGSAVGKTMGDLDIFRIPTGAFIVVTQDGLVQEVRSKQAMIERIRSLPIDEADREFLLGKYGLGKRGLPKISEW